MHLAYIWGSPSVSSHCVVPENIHTPPAEDFFGLNPRPLWKFQFRLILSSKNFGLLRPPLLLGISSDPLWLGVWIFSGTTH